MQAKNDGLKVVYIDLCKTEVSPFVLQNIMTTLKSNSMKIIWNLSENTSIGDSVMQLLSCFDNIIGLNVSKTQVSDNGLNVFISAQSQLPDSSIQFINVYGSAVQSSNIQMAKMQFDSILTRYRMNHPNENISSNCTGIINELNVDSTPKFSNNNIINNLPTGIMNNFGYNGSNFMNARLLW